MRRLLVSHGQLTPTHIHLRVLAVLVGLDMELLPPTLPVKLLSPTLVSASSVAVYLTPLLNTCLHVLPSGPRALLCPRLACPWRLLSPHPLCSG